MRLAIFFVFETSPLRHVHVPQLQVFTRLGGRSLGLLTPNNLLRKISMMLSRPNLATELSDIDENLFSLPAKSMCHEQDKSLAVSLKPILGVGTHSFLDRVFRPSANRVLRQVLDP